MPSTKNVDALAQIKEDLADVQAVWVVDYRGLTVKEAQELRRNIREAGAVMKVYKNTLMHIALKELDMADMDEILSGPSAFVFADGDPVASAKALRDFSKDNETLVIKGGIMDGQVRRMRGSQEDRSSSFARRTHCEASRFAPEPYVADRARAQRTARAGRSHHRCYCRPEECSLNCA